MCSIFSLQEEKEAYHPLSEYYISTARGLWKDYRYVPEDLWPEKRRHHSLL